MHFPGRWMLPLALVLAGGLFLGGPAAAQKSKMARKVEDVAGVFSPDAVARANADIADIKRQHNKDLYIETVLEAPAGVTPQNAEKWAAQEWAQRKVDGVLVLIAVKSRILQVHEGDRTRNETIFTLADAKELRDVMLKHIKEATTAGDKEEARKHWDMALTDGTAYVKRTMNTNQPAGVSGKKADGTNQAVGGKKSDGTTSSNATETPWYSSILGLICIGLVVVFLIWVVFAIIRALTAPRYPPGYAGGPGGGPGYGGGGYGGGGGGGFFPSLLGGLFGAAAGMWMYNSFFGGGGYGGHMGGGYGGGSGYNQGGGSSGAVGDADTGDVGGGSSGVGGTWGGGEDAGGKGDVGGDKGGDKGDWSGGGGDYGGGGGDEGGGGGGGGDWGGGGGDGGGGGGGGDWGGGGGGGDFGGGGGGGGGDW